MDETVETSKRNTRILLARNTPVALVVEAGSFLGSHLVDRLLDKGLQVVGVDNLTIERKRNLSKAIENRNFHLVDKGIEELDLELEKLDYIFAVLSRGADLKGLLSLFNRTKSRLLLISSVDLYGDGTIDRHLLYLKKSESQIAKYAKDNNLNARILRLGAVFGPRMDFVQPDPLIRLIRQSLNGELQKEIALEFSARALYVDDAVELVIKCILAGATAQKIFDGVLPSPIKVSEIKQVLLDPVWYETKNFHPSELPPWPTPNLEKTIKFLNWHPHSQIVAGLKETINYFRENEINLSKEDKEEKRAEKKSVEQEWSREKAKELEGLKEGSQKKEIKPKLHLSSISFLGIVALITFALIWPIAAMSWGILTFKFQLSEAVKALEKGEFESSINHVSQAQWGVTEAQSIFHSLEPIRQAGVLQSQFEIGDNLSQLAALSTDAASDTILGIQSLYHALRSVTGDLTDKPTDSFDQAQLYLSSADEKLSKATALANSPQFQQSLPNILKSRVNSLADKLSSYTNLVKKSRSLAVLLPEVVGLEGTKSYLILLQNNSELRPTGGFIGSFAKVVFEGGKLKKLEVNDIYAIDGQLKIHVEPPKEIKEDLGQKDYFLRDSNWEPDFPTSARQAEWFFNKETGERVEGVVSLDISAMEDLLTVLGPLDLTDYNLRIGADNLFAEAVSHAEVGFFPGSQAKKSFLTALTQGIFNRLFFLPNQNWPGIVSSMGRSLERKHMSIYLDNPTLFSYIVSQNWSSQMPRGEEQTDKPMADFLAPVEANLGANKANYYLDRSYKLETVIGKDGDIFHRLRIGYTNRSPSDTFPAGKYKNRMRIYLPFGTKLTRALWGEKDITKDVLAFADYGRTAYSFLVELEPKEQKTLVLDYQLPLKLQFIDNKALYKLDVVKQPGTGKDPFVWNVTYPLNMKLSNTQAQQIGPQEQIVQTDLSTDRSFQMAFER